MAMSKRIRSDDFAEFVRSYNPVNRHDRKPTWSEANLEGVGANTRAKELLACVRPGSDVFWLKDKTLTDFDNLPEPEELAEEIIEISRPAWRA